MGTPAWLGQRPAYRFAGARRLTRTRTAWPPPSETRPYDSSCTSISAPVPIRFLLLPAGDLRAPSPQSSLHRPPLVGTSWPAIRTRRRRTSLLTCGNGPSHGQHPLHPATEHWPRTRPVGPAHKVSVGLQAMRAGRQVPSRLNLDGQSVQPVVGEGSRRHNRTAADSMTTQPDGPHVRGSHCRTSKGRPGTGGVGQAAITTPPSRSSGPAIVQYESICPPRRVSRETISPARQLDMRSFATPEKVCARPC